VASVYCAAICRTDARAQVVLTTALTLECGCAHTQVVLITVLTLLCSTNLRQNIRGVGVLRRYLLRNTIKRALAEAAIPADTVTPKASALHPIERQNASN
jgi:hypothetical protein